MAEKIFNTRSNVLIISKNFILTIVFKNQEKISNKLLKSLENLADFKAKNIQKA